MVKAVRAILMVALATVGGWAMTAGAQAAERAGGTAWDFAFTSIDGDAMPLKAYEGKALLVVNTGFSTPPKKRSRRVSLLFSAGSNSARW